MDTDLKPQTFREYKEELKEKYTGMSKDQVLKQMNAQSESAVDLDNLPKQSHKQVDRGANVTCEGGDHPYHAVYKRIN